MPEATVAAIITSTRNSIAMLLLTRRAHEPFKGQWCLPGGRQAFTSAHPRRLFQCSIPFCSVP